MDAHDDLSGYRPSWQTQGTAAVPVRPAHLSGQPEPGKLTFDVPAPSERRAQPRNASEEPAAFPPDGWEVVTTLRLVVSGGNMVATTVNTIQEI